MGIRQQSIFHGAALRDYIGRVIPETDWRELRIPLTVNAVDLETGRTVWFGAGGRTDVPLVDAIYASSALPPFYPPLAVDGMHLVDGGVMDAVPVTKAADRRADLILAVHASSGRTRDAADTVDKGLIAIQHRVMDIMSFAHREVVEDMWLGPRVVHVRPDVAQYSTFDFDAVDYFIAEGYRAMKAALELEGLSGAPPTS
jgi:predicted acylesterase/phospholipase RssA